MPERARAPDVLVVGGGIVGVCTALYLQRTGRSVTLVERADVGSGASGHNGGAFSIGDCAPIAMPGVVRSVPHMLRDPLSPFAVRWRYVPRLTPWLLRFVAAGRHVERISETLAALMAASMPAYQPLLDDSDAGAWIEQRGLLYGYQGDKAFEDATFGVALRERRGTRFEVLDAADIAQLDPALEGRFRHGIFLPGAHHTRDPRRFTQALADRFLESGGKIQQAEVRGFDRSGDRVTAAVTDDGRLPAGAVVVAAGAWSRTLAKDLGVQVPLDTERGYGVHLPSPGLTLAFPVISGDHHVALCPDEPGIRVVGTVELAGLHRPANPERAERLLRGARQIVPELATARSRWWMSYRPSMPDSLPVIGRAPQFANAFLAFGHGHKGLAQGAITGLVVSELVNGATSSLDLEPLRPDRFRVRRAREPKRARTSA